MRGGRPKGQSTRAKEWPPRWRDLAAACGGARALAARVGVHQQTLWRWASKGAYVPPPCANLIASIAGEMNLPNPLANDQSS